MTDSPEPPATEANNCTTNVRLHSVVPTVYCTLLNDIYQRTAILPPTTDRHKFAILSTYVLYIKSVQLHSSKGRSLLVLIRRDQLNASHEHGIPRNDTHMRYYLLCVLCTHVETG